MEKRYTVHQATEMTGTKSYVLRYWEEELGLAINRNELGHRYYTESDIQLFLNVKELKNRGLQLRAIKDLIGTDSSGELESLKKELEKDEVPKEDSAKKSLNTASDESEKFLEFQQILERLIEQEIHRKKDGENRCRSLDEAIRRQQQARKEAAAALDKKKDRKKARSKSNNRRFSGNLMNKC
jgi:DNA-binding transcriptional MerR regulator